MDCPKCSIGRLVPATLQVFSRDHSDKGSVSKLEVDQCGGCGGIWFDAGELKSYLDGEMTVLGSPGFGKEGEVDLDKKAAKCPRCGVELVRAGAPRDKSVTADHCAKCGGLWLDCAELDKLESSGASWLGKFNSVLGSWFPRLKASQDFKAK